MLSNLETAVNICYNKQEFYLTLLHVTKKHKLLSLSVYFSVGLKYALDYT